MDNALQAVRDFVVNVLGCKCPEEVFREIRLDREPGPVGGIPLLFEIRVGGRLLIYGAAADHLRDSGEAVRALAAAGMRVRDDLKFNRFRLVAEAGGNTAGTELRRQFAELAGLDDRVHLHVVAKDEVRGFCR